MFMLGFDKNTYAVAIRRSDLETWLLMYPQYKQHEHENGDKYLVGDKQPRVLLILEDDNPRFVFNLPPVPLAPEGKSFAEKLREFFVVWARFQS
jgi:hypothetical protein